ncbi:hypothetical protein GPJ56_005683 [Histomonas meleagridis]|uniref:uncharacterized protein n=1 Tax=Histomonas meleagridis TaxID=135588 RepID=UPI00355A714D|nr:hypothetical protein GPJ56_005683 [Histomonas meleagridis]KAH0803382.1 hypothetical protein GO595_003726 [Histomonas meleagridis]
MSQILNRITLESSKVEIKTSKVSGVKSRRPLRPTKVIVNKVSVPTPSSEEDFDSQWSIINSCITSVISNSSQANFEPAFRSVERLNKKAENTEKINAKLTEKLDLFSKQMIENIESKSDIDSIISSWCEIQRVITLISSIFTVFERSFMSPKTIKGVVIYFLKQKLHQKQQLIDEICKTLAGCITNQRKIEVEGNDTIPPQEMYINQTIEIISSFEIEGNFTSELNRQTEEFYSNFNIDDADQIEFLKAIKRVVTQEEKIIEKFPIDIRKSYMHHVYECLYVKKIQNIMVNTITKIYELKDFKCLELLSNLISIAEDTELYQCFDDVWTKEVSNQCANALSLKSINVIKELLQIHHSIVVCKPNVDSKDVEKEFKHSINKASLRIAFLLAKFCHVNIIENSEEFDKMIDSIILLFRQFESMDVFVEHYKQFLGMRLLNYEDVPSVETDFIEKLQMICGEEDVKSMVGMINDFDHTKVVNSEFTASASFQIRFVLISEENWPRYQKERLRIPLEILDSQSQFVTFYKEHYKRRTLEWMDVLSSCTFVLNKTVITGSTVYYLIIESIVKGTLIEETGINADSVTAAINVLLQKGIIKKENNQYEITENENEGNIVLPVPSFLSPKKMKKQTIDEIFAIRKMKIEAALVMIMKRLRSSNKEKLLVELKNSSQFDVTKEDFEMCLNSLIEKSFFEVGSDGEINYIEI